VDCGVTSPSVTSKYGLLDAEFGWSLIRRSDVFTGKLLSEWRCPSCWEDYGTDARVEPLSSLPFPAAAPSGTWTT
jgi:hypothetical protein